MSTTSFNAASEYIRTNPTHVHSLLVSQNDQILHEEYFEGFQASDLQDVQSVTKSIVGLLIGIALDQGHIQDVHQTVETLLPESIHLVENEKRRISLRQLLMMTSGLEWRDWRDPAGKASSFDEIIMAKDSVRYILGRPLVSQPGKEFFYNTGSSHLLAQIIQSKTGLSVAAFAETNLFGPLGITRYKWDSLRDGTYQGGWGLWLRPADLLKIGQLVQHRGEWKGRRIIREDYLDRMCIDHVEATGFDGYYGYHWWIEDTSDDALVMAKGYGGQRLIVCKKQKTVIVFTGDIQFPMSGLTEPEKITKTILLKSTSP